MIRKELDVPTRKEFDAHLAETVTGLNNVKNYGAKGDGATDDLAILIQVRDIALANNKSFHIPNDFNCYISGDLDLTGIKNIDIRGTITGASIDNVVTFGNDSRNAKSVNIFINTAKTIKVKLQGLMNGNVEINFAEYLLVYADGEGISNYAVGYSRFKLGYVDTIEITSVNEGWINENKFFGGRIHSLTLGGSYPHNNNIFYGLMLENFTGIINGNYNYFYDCRLEADVNITFGIGSVHNYFFRSHFPVWSSYHKDSPNANTANFIITDNGYSNGIISTPDMANKKECIFEVSPGSRNFNVYDFTKGQTDIEINTAYKVIFDSGIIELTNPLSLVLKSNADLFEIRLFAYDIDKNLLTTSQDYFTNMPYFSDTSYFYHYNAVKGIYNTGVPIIPTDTVKYFRYEVRTGAVVGQKFKFAKVIQIQKNDHWTKIIPVIGNRKNYSNAGPTRPTRGYWYVGEYVENSNLEKLGSDGGTQYIVRGWYRLREGTTFVNNVDWIEDKAYYSNLIDQGDTTANRPLTPVNYQRYFDTTLGKPIWWNGTNWVDAAGTIV